MDIILSIDVLPNSHKVISCCFVTLGLFLISAKTLICELFKLLLPTLVFSLILLNGIVTVVNNHPAIISAEQFKQVIQEIKRRSNVSYDEHGKAHRKDSKYSSKVKDH